MDVYAGFRIAWGRMVAAAPDSTVQGEAKWMERTIILNQKKKNWFSAIDIF